MLIKDLVGPKAYFDANKQLKNITSHEAKYGVNKLILSARVRKYIERGARLAFNINIIYGIIWVQFVPGQ